MVYYSRSLVGEMKEVLSEIFARRRPDRYYEP